MKRCLSLKYCMFVILVGFGLVVGLHQAYAVEIPPEGSAAFIQTSGPNAPLGNGDFYTSVDGANEPHTIQFDIPCVWPTDRPLTIALFDPESQVPDPLNPSAIDEIDGTADDTTFTLNDPNGATIANELYTPNGGTNGLWVELVTFQPNTPAFACGTYSLETTTSDDDEQSWRLLIGHDPDCTVSNSGPGSCSGIGTPQSNLLSNNNETDNPDGVLGTGDELAIGLLQVSFQHAANNTCQTFFFYVGDIGTVTLHNFDMDDRDSITYFPPSGGTVVGAVSGRTLWNDGTASTRGGDDIPVSENDLGWWRAEVCTGPGNQYIFEGEENEPIFYQQPPTPLMVVSKDDGETVVTPNDLLTYTLAFTNTSDTTNAPGAASNVTLTDTLPTNATFESCAIQAPLTGTCTETNGVVTAEIDGLVAASTGGSVLVTVRVNPGATGSVVNDVTLEYEDTSGRRFPPERDRDTNTIPTGPAIDANKTVVALNSGAIAPCQALANETLEYTVEIVNNGNQTATGVVFNDTPDANTTLVPGSVQTSQGTVVTGASPISVDIGDIAAGETVTITYRVTITDTLTGETDIINQGEVSGTNFAPILTDDPTTPAVDDPTDIRACPEIGPAPPILEAGKRVQSNNNAPAGCQVIFGQTLSYSVIIVNNGDLSATGVIYDDEPDANTDIVPGSIRTSQGSVTRGNNAGDTSMSIDIGTIEPGSSVRVDYETTVRSLSSDQPVTLVNQGIVRSTNADTINTDDPDTAAPDDPTEAIACPVPTAVVLERFTATRQGEGIVVRWVTSAEIDTWGFHLYRSSDGQRESAEQVTPELILARGRGQDGASYTWEDTDAGSEGMYTYWLQEIETDGSTNEYGPANTAALSDSRIIFLPVIVQ